jgi:hypothetical protein
MQWHNVHSQLIVSRGYDKIHIIAPDRQLSNACQLNVSVVKRADNPPAVTASLVAVPLCVPWSSTTVTRSSQQADLVQ